MRKTVCNGGQTDHSGVLFKYRIVALWRDVKMEVNMVKTKKLLVSLLLVCFVLSTVVALGVIASSPRMAFAADAGKYVLKVTSAFNGEILIAESSAINVTVKEQEVQQPADPDNKDPENPGETPSASEDSGLTQMEQIIGVAVVAAIAVIVLIIGIVIIKKHKKKQKEEEQS